MCSAHHVLHVPTERDQTEQGLEPNKVTKFKVDFVNCAFLEKENFLQHRQNVYEEKFPKQEKSPNVLEARQTVETGMPVKTRPQFLRSPGYYPGANSKKKR